MSSSILLSIKMAKFHIWTYKVLIIGSHYQNESFLD